MASLVLHGLALACLALFVHPQALPKAVQQAISVILVTPPQPVAKSLAPPVLTAPDTASGDASTPAQAPEEPDMIEAEKMLSSAVFADPRNAEARAMLARLDVFTRHEQLCVIEALEQLKAYNPDWHPDTIITYAFADMRVDDTRFIADGAAVLIGELWYRLRFVCTLAEDYAAVVALGFDLGDLISEADVEKYGLAPAW